MLENKQMKSILMYAIHECSGMTFTEETISKGIDLALQRMEIIQVKQDGQEIFSVNVTPDGVGFWSTGGFSHENNCGTFVLPTDPKGGPLKELARISEKNGRHTFHHIYPGCKILQCVCPNPPVINTRIYTVMRINEETGHAYCKRSYLGELSSLEIDQLEGAISVAMEGCTKTNNEDNHFFWRNT